MGNRKTKKTVAKIIFETIKPVISPSFCHSLAIINANGLINIPVNPAANAMINNTVTSKIKYNNRNPVVITRQVSSAFSLFILN